MNLILRLLTLAAVLAFPLTQARADWTDPTQSPTTYTYSLTQGVNDYILLQQEFGPSLPFYYYCQGYIDAYRLVAAELEAGEDDYYEDIPDAINTCRMMAMEWPEGSFASAYFNGLADTYAIVLADVEAGETITQ